MKRREFVKTIPAAALVSTGVSVRPEDAEAASTSVAMSDPQSSSGSPQGFSVANPNLDDLGVHDSIHCDQFGIDSEGKPIADNLTGTGSDVSLKSREGRA
jgi:hypothetical protein